MPVASHSQNSTNSAPMSPSRQPPALPSEILLLAESQWLFTEAELLRTPSVLDGLSPEKERENRSKGVNFILQVGIMLKLPQITLATANVFLHRFYMRHSMVDLPNRPGFHYYSMAATSLFLATKVEEDCRKMKDLVIACVRVAQKDPGKVVDEQDKEYWRWKDNILHNEDLLLEAICFDLSLEPPHKTMFELLMFFGEQDNKRLRNAAWAFVNDSCMTVLCLLFPSRTIAASSLYAAAKHCGVCLPDDAQGRPWWETIGVKLRSIRRACNIMATMYETIPFRTSREAVTHEQTPEDGDEATAKTRAVREKIDGHIDSTMQEARRGVSLASGPLGVHGDYLRTERDELGNLEHNAATDGAEGHNGNGPSQEINGGLVDGNDITDGSPRKRQKVNGDAAYPNGMTTSPEPPAGNSTTNGAHAEAVSEEGEVEP